MSKDEILDGINEVAMILRSEGRWAVSQAVYKLDALSDKLLKDEDIDDTSKTTNT